MGCDHLTCASLHMHDVTAVRGGVRQVTPESQQGQKHQQEPRAHPLYRPLLHAVGAVVRIIAQQRGVSLPFHYELFLPRTGETSKIRTKGSPYLYSVRESETRKRKFSPLIEKAPDVP